MRYHGAVAAAVTARPPARPVLGHLYLPAHLCQSAQALAALLPCCAGFDLLCKLASACKIHALSACCYHQRCTNLSQRLVWPTEQQIVQQQRHAFEQASNHSTTSLRPLLVAVWNILSAMLGCLMTEQI